MGNRKRGGQPYEPSEADRNTVKNMAAAGFPQDAIARCLGENGIAEGTLRKHFKRELKVSADMANALVASMLFQKAKAGEPWAICFWLKTRARWRETNSTDEGPASEPTRIEVVYRRSPHKELEAGDVVDLPRAVGEE